MKDEEENESFSNWIKYRRYDNFTDICADFCHILDRIHDYSEFRADGLRGVTEIHPSQRGGHFKAPC